MALKVKFPEGVGSSSQKNLSVGGVWKFSGTTHQYLIYFLTFKKKRLSA